MYVDDKLMVLVLLQEYWQNACFLPLCVYIQYDMLLLRREKERLEQLEQEALEVERQAQLKLQRHQLAEESIVMSKLADMKCQKAKVSP